MDCTTLHLQKRTVYRGLALLLLSALLLQCPLPLAAQSHAAWDEGLVPWPRGCRSRRWRRYRQKCLSFLARRAQVLLCRVGLVAALLLWRGLPQREPGSWALMGVPVVEAWLAVLPLWWPGVARRRSYLYLVQGMRQLYLGVLVLLLGEGLTSQAGGAAALVLVGGGVQQANGAQAEGWIDDDGTWHLVLQGPCFHFSYKPRDEFEERALLIFFRQIRTPQSTPKRPLLRQEWLAAWFDTHQELISRWQKYVRQGGLLKLRGEPEARVLTPQLREAIPSAGSGQAWTSG